MVLLSRNKHFYHVAVFLWCHQLSIKVPLSSLDVEKIDIIKIKSMAFGDWLKAWVVLCRLTTVIRAKYSPFNLACPLLFKLSVYCVSSFKNSLYKSFHNHKYIQLNLVLHFYDFINAAPMFENDVVSTQPDHWVTFCNTLKNYSIYFFTFIIRHQA